MKTFFALCVVYVLGPLLERVTPRFSLRWTLELVFWYNESCEEVRSWHKRRLEMLDPIYRLQMAGQRLFKARLEAHEKGISPSDPRYPDLVDFAELPNLESVPRPQKLEIVP